MLAKPGEKIPDQAVTLMPTLRVFLLQRGFPEWVGVKFLRDWLLEKKPEYRNMPFKRYCKIVDQGMKWIGYYRGKSSNRRSPQYHKTEIARAVQQTAATFI